MPMVPQVATGTVMLLIVLVGLWSLPQLTRRRAQPRFEEHATGEVIRPTRADVPAVTPTAAPAETSTSAARSPQRGHPPPSAATSTQDDEITAAEQRKNALEAGIVHFRAREYAQATPLLSRALARATNSAEQAMTLLYLARAERAVGHCDRAVNSYAALVRVHSGMAEAQAALREGVACYDELSEPARAQHLLEQAVATRSLAAGARSLLAQRASGNRKPSTSSATPTSGGAGTRAQRMQPADAQGPNSPVSR
jgi:tetratricopeptide (TPR) repeat protein